MSHIVFLISRFGNFERLAHRRMETAPAFPVAWSLGSEIGGQA